MATYYWVGGSGTWDNATATNWSLTSGGAGGAGIPTGVDTTTFDANSGTGAVTIAATALCQTCNFGGSGITATLNANHVTIFGSISFSITAGVFDCSTFNVTFSSTLTVSGGTFRCNGGVITAARLNSGGNNARTISLGASTLNLSGAIGFGGTNLVFDAGTSQINCSNPVIFFSSNGQTFYNVSFTSTAISTVIIVGNNTFNNLTFATRSATASIGKIQFAGNQIINGTLTINGNNSVSRYFCTSDLPGTTRTITCNTAVLTDVDFQDITHNGTIWSGTRLGDCGGNSGITFPAPKTVYWVSAANATYQTAWATTSGGTGSLANFPLPQDTAVFTNAGPAPSGTITLAIPYNIGSLSFSNRTYPLSFNITGTSPVPVYGDITLASSVTLAGTNKLIFSGRNKTQTVISSGVLWPQPLDINAIGSNIVLGSALTRSNTLPFSLLNGTLDLAGYTLTVAAFSTSTGTKNITFNGGTLAVTGLTTSAFSNTSPVGFTTTAGIGVGKISMLGATAKTFVGGGSVYNCTLNQGGAGQLTITDANTFNDITSTTTQTTITFPASTTTIVNNFSLNGTSGNLITIQSSTAGTQATISKVDGTVSVINLGIKDIRVIGGASWYANLSSGNVDGGNNNGWIWTAPPINPINPGFFALFN